MTQPSSEQSVTQSPSMAAAPDPVAGVCPVCRAQVTSDFVACPHCNMRHHPDCWEYNGGCGAYGCAAAPVAEKLTDMEIPPSFWGQSEKKCPVCQNQIQAAALRCRFCNTVFSTVRPQEAGEFHQQRTLAGELPKLRRQSIILMVFCVIPFTAALAAIIGGVWYAGNRQRIAALPASVAAIPKIALGVAILQSLILIVVLAFHALTSH